MDLDEAEFYFQLQRQYVDHKKVPEENIYIYLNKKTTRKKDELCSIRVVYPVEQDEKYLLNADR